VLACLRAWSQLSVYHFNLVDKLRETFIGKTQEELEKQRAFASPLPQKQRSYIVHMDYKLILYPIYPVSSHFCTSSLALYPGFLYQMLSHCFGETHEENLSKG